MNMHRWIFVALLLSGFATPLFAQTNTNTVARAAKGDLDGDGYGDVILQHQETGYVAALGLVENEWVWGGYLGGGFDVRPLRLVGSLDLDFDGTEDLLWRYGDTDQYIWSIMNQTNVVDTDFLFDADTFKGWSVLTTADFDADGYGDLLVRHEASGVWAVAYLVDFELVSLVFIEGWETYRTWSVVAAGDVDGDTFPDIVVERPRTGEAAILWMNGAELLEVSPIAGSDNPATLLPWRIVGLSDIDGTGSASFLMQYGQTGYVEVYRTIPDGDDLVFEAEPLAGFTNGIGRWRVIGPR